MIGVHEDAVEMTTGEVCDVVIELNFFMFGFFVIYAQFIVQCRVHCELVTFAQSDTSDVRGLEFAFV